MRKQHKWLRCLFRAALFSLTALPVFAQQPDTLFSLKSPFEESGGQFGTSVSGAGDVNMDGKADVIVGAPDEDPGSSPDDAGRAYVFGFPADGGVIIDIDIKPRHCPNNLNIKSKGVISAALVGTEDLDVSTINPESVRLEGMGSYTWDE